MLHAYFRQKRIRRILNFYSNLQSYGVVAVGGVPTDLGHGKSVLVSREARLHFFLTIGFFALLGVPLGAVLARLPSGEVGNVIRLVVMCVAGVLAVECADAVLARFLRALDVTFDYLLPLVALALLGAMYVPLKQLGADSDWAAGLASVRQSVNTRLQGRPIREAVTPTAGRNWFFVSTADGALQPLDRSHAAQACSTKGVGWKLYDGDSAFAPEPAPQFLRTVSVWYGGGMPVAQIGETSGLARPQAFSSADATDLRATLCVRPGGP